MEIGIGVLAVVLVFVLAMAWAVRASRRPDRWRRAHAAAPFHVGWSGSGASTGWSGGGDCGGGGDGGGGGC